MSVSFSTAAAVQLAAAERKVSYEDDQSEAVLQLHCSGVADATVATARADGRCRCGCTLRPGVRRASGMALDGMRVPCQSVPCAIVQVRQRRRRLCVSIAVSGGEATAGGVRAFILANRHIEIAVLNAIDLLCTGACTGTSGEGTQ
jgi:hypothetical protein